MLAESSWLTTQMIRISTSFTPHLELCKRKGWYIVSLHSAWFWRSPRLSFIKSPHYSQFRSVLRKQISILYVYLCVINKTSWLTKKLNIKFAITCLQSTFKEHDVPIWLTSLPVTLNSPEPLIVFATQLTVRKYSFNNNSP